MSITAAQAANEAAEAIRTLNYATLPHEGAPGLTCPADVYDVIGALLVAHTREQQALRQLWQYLTAGYQAGKVAHDSGQDAEKWVAEVRDWLGAAEASTRQLAGVLDRAHNASAGLKFKAAG